MSVALHPYYLSLSSLGKLQMSRHFKVCVSVLLQEANVHNLSHRQGVTYLANMCVGRGGQCTLFFTWYWKERKTRRAFPLNPFNIATQTFWARRPSALCVGANSQSIYAGVVILILGYYNQLMYIQTGRAPLIISLLLQSFSKQKCQKHDSSSLLNKICCLSLSSINSEIQSLWVFDCWLEKKEQIKMSL